MQVSMLIVILDQLMMCQGRQLWPIYNIPNVKKKRRKKQESKEWRDKATINQEELLMLSDFNGHYDTPKCKYTTDREITASSNVSSLYDQPRIIKPNLGKWPAANVDSEL